MRRVLPHGRARDQARDARRGLSTWPRRALPGIAALGGMIVWRSFTRDQLGFARNPARLGDPVGHRHRIRARRARTPRLARSGLAQGLPDRAGDSRRPRRRRDHRPVLHRRSVAADARLTALTLALLTVLNVAGVTRLAPYLVVGAALVLRPPVRRSRDPGGVALALDGSAASDARAARGRGSRSISWSTRSSPGWPS